MYSESDLFFKLVDMGFALKGLLTKVKSLDNEYEIIEWITTDKQTTTVELKKHIELDTFKVFWEIKEWK